MENKKEIIFVLLNEFADWEGAYISTCLRIGVKPESPTNYKVKTLSLTKDPITSIGGFRVLPDYDLDDMPKDHAGLILIGGMNWFTCYPSLHLFLTASKVLIQSSYSPNSENKPSPKLEFAPCQVNMFLSLLQCSTLE